MIFKTNFDCAPLSKDKFWQYVSWKVLTFSNFEQHGSIELHKISKVLSNFVFNN